MGCIRWQLVPSCAAPHGTKFHADKISVAMQEYQSHSPPPPNQDPNPNPLPAQSTQYTWSCRRLSTRRSRRCETVSSVLRSRDSVAIASCTDSTRHAFTLLSETCRTFARDTDKYAVRRLSGSRRAIGGAQFSVLEGGRDTKAS
jgi:hypothetical protein